MQNFEKIRTKQQKRKAGELKDVGRGRKKTQHRGGKSKYFDIVEG